MDGGILAWNGLTAQGPPEAGMTYFGDEDRIGELVSLAWSLEEGSRRFYESVAELVKDEETRLLLGLLVGAEEQHKQALFTLAAQLKPDTPPPLLKAELLSDDLTRDTMEGGMRVSKAVAWAKGKDLVSILEFLMALETNAYDLYLKMERKMEGKEASAIFSRLAREEAEHLERLTALFEKSI